jgi:uncharacterized membrane protein HdeD (DUF308 family)
MVVLARNWWAVALRGVAAVLFGVAALIWPGLTLGILVLLFGAYVLVDGIFALILAIQRATHHTRWWPLLLEGLAGIVVGLLTFFWPGITALVLLVLIASWAIVTGFLELIAAMELRREIANEWLLGLSGLASVLFGVLLILMPGAGALALVWLIGVYALVFGILLLGLAYRLRELEATIEEQRP